MDLLRAEIRGYRELYLSGRQLVHHWTRLADALAETEAAVLLSNAAGAVREMLAALAPLTARHDLYGGTMAQGGGARLGQLRSIGADRFLERNQALRLALHDIEHLTTLLLYLARLSETRGDEELPDFCRSWERRLRQHSDEVRKAAIEMGDDPEAAIAPVEDSHLGRAAHRVTFGVGAVGEWLDRRLAQRRG